MANDKSIFISYSSKDSLFVNEILSVLRALGCNYWRAPEMIPAGSNYAREIPRVIESCDIVLLIVSKNSQESIWVEKEIDSAINHHKKIVPINLDNTELNTVFKFYLNNVQMIPYKTDKDNRLEELKVSLGRIVANVEDEDISYARSTVRENSVKKEAIRRTNLFNMNKVQEDCDACGGDLEQIGIGTYKCVKCGKICYDYLYTVRNYLEKYGPTPTLIIERETGVPRKVIDYFFKEEYLEIPSHSSFRVSCKRCGIAIRTGEYCDRCKDFFKTEKDKKNSKWRSSI